MSRGGQRGRNRAVDRSIRTGIRRDTPDLESRIRFFEQVQSLLSQGARGIVTPRILRLRARQQRRESE